MEKGVGLFGTRTGSGILSFATQIGKAVGVEVMLSGGLCS